MVAKCFQTWSKIARIFAKKYIVHGAVTAAAEAVKTLVGFWLHIDYVLGTPKYEKWLGNFPTNTTILEISTIVVLGIAWATIHIVLANSKKKYTNWVVVAPQNFRLGLKMNECASFTGAFNVCTTIYLVLYNTCMYLDVGNTDWSFEIGKNILA